MNTCSGVRSCLPARLFSFSRPAASPARRRAQTWRSLVITPCALDELQIRLRRPYVREASAGFRLERLATTSINNPANLSDPRLSARNLDPANAAAYAACSGEGAVSA
jgi:hypothetical protein